MMMMYTETVTGIKYHNDMGKNVKIYSTKDVQFLRVFVEKTTTVVQKNKQSLRYALEKKLLNFNMKIDCCVAYDHETNKVIDWDKTCSDIKLDCITVKPKGNELKHQFVTKLSLKTEKLAITVRSCDACDKKITFKISVCKKCNYSICQNMDCMQVSEGLLCKEIKRRNSLTSSISSSLLNLGKNAFSPTRLNSNISSFDESLNVISEQILPVTEIIFSDRLRSSSDSELEKTASEPVKDLNNNNRISTFMESVVNTKPLMRENKSLTNAMRRELTVSCEIPYDQIYINEEIIGRGSFGTVRLGEYFGKIAIKFINSITPSPHQVAKFKYEMDLLKKSRHSNILLYVGCVTEPSFAIVTEYCEGLTLYRHIHVHETITDSSLILNIANQTADAMSFLHSKDILHRDLKSNNIFLDDSKQQSLKVKIGDFGLAILTKELRNSKSNCPSGSILWMAPEVITQRVEDPYTIKADVYSYAVVLYELVTGHLPFPNKEQNMIFFLVGSGRLKLDINDAREDTPKVLLDLMKVCSKYNRDERHTFKEIKQILQKSETENFFVKRKAILRRISF